MCGSAEEQITLTGPTYFGDVGGFIESTRTSTVLAQTECDLLVITAQKIFDVLKEYPEQEKSVKDFIESRKKWWIAHQKFQPDEKFGGEFFLEIARRDLKKLPIFENADQDFLEDILFKINPEVFKSNEKIITAGDDSDCMYFIVNGAVQVVGQNNKIHAEMRSGQFFGEIGIFLNIKRTANVKAIQDCYLLKLTKSSLDAVSNHYPSMQAIIKKEANERYELVQKREQQIQQIICALPTSEPLIPDEHDVEVSRQNLKRLDIFKSVDNSILNELALKMEQTDINANEFIIKCGDKADSMFFVAHGKVEIISEFGQTFDHAEGPTAYFGEVAILEDLPRTASVRALTNCSIYTLKKFDLQQTFEKCPELAEKIKETSKERLQAYLMRNVLA